MQTIARLQGDTVKDLIEALSRLDPDAKVLVGEARTLIVNGKRELEFDKELALEFALRVFEGTDCGSADPENILVYVQDLESKLSSLESRVADAIQKLEG